MLENVSLNQAEVKLKIREDIVPLLTLVVEAGIHFKEVKHLIEEELAKLAENKYKNNTTKTSASLGVNRGTLFKWRKRNEQREQTLNRGDTPIINITVDAL